MVSFYLKDENVMIEVFLYHEAKQMSNTSTVSAIPHINPSIPFIPVY